MIPLGWAWVDQVDAPGAAVELRGEVLELDSACLPNGAAEGERVLIWPVRPGCHLLAGRRSLGQNAPEKGKGEES